MAFLLRAPEGAQPAVRRARIRKVAAQVVARDPQTPAAANLVAALPAKAKVFSRDRAAVAAARAAKAVVVVRAEVPAVAVPRVKAEGRPEVVAQPVPAKASAVADC